MTPLWTTIQELRGNIPSCGTMGNSRVMHYIISAVFLHHHADGMLANHENPVFRHEQEYRS